MIWYDIIYIFRYTVYGIRYTVYEYIWYDLFIYDIWYMNDIWYMIYDILYDDKLYEIYNIT